MGMPGQPGMGMPGQPGMGMPGQPGMGQQGMCQPGMGQPGMGMQGKPGICNPGYPGQPGMGMQGQQGMGMQGQFPGQQGQAYGQQGQFPGQQGMGGPLNLSHQYQFTHHQINEYGMRVFQQCDVDRSGALSIQEGQRAISEFCQMCNQPQPNQNDFQVLFSMYDHDRSGQLDYGEFKMMLEHMGNLHHYSQNEIINMRQGRGGRIQGYQSGSACQMF